RRGRDRCGGGRALSARRAPAHPEGGVHRRVEAAPPDLADAPVDARRELRRGRPAHFVAVIVIAIPWTPRLAPARISCTTSLRMKLRSGLRCTASAVPRSCR